MVAAPRSTIWRETFGSSPAASSSWNTSARAPSSRRKIARSNGAPVRTGRRGRTGRRRRAMRGKKYVKRSAKSTRRNGRGGLHALRGHGGGVHDAADVED